ncbi:MAG: GNAT family N-acetyltransferase [Proteobacteria bacterium]|nr:GNAT family N-acetyltransferase [Pseudomonadota bacterium]
MSLARELEPVSDRAWSAEARADLGGWRLNASRGFSGRINACWPLAAPDRPVGDAIAAVEAWYAARGLPPVFKLAEAAVEPNDLAGRLQARGYRSHTETLMMTGPVAGAADPGVLVGEALDPDFAAVFAAAGHADPADTAERLGALERTPRPRGFARFDVAGAPVAIGAVAVDGDWAGVFAMRTAAAHRRQGLGGRIFRALLDHAAREGARRAYLQVEAVNAPAIALYQQAGFSTAYSYLYWTKP